MDTLRAGIVIVHKDKILPRDFGKTIFRETVSELTVVLSFCREFWETGTRASSEDFWPGEDTQL